MQLTKDHRVLFYLQWYFKGADQWCIHLKSQTSQRCLERKQTNLGNFAAKNVSKGREGVVHGLIVDRFVEVLDEDISNSGSAETGVSLAPHDPNGFALQDVEVHRIQSTFSWKQNIETEARTEERLGVMTGRCII